MADTKISALTAATTPLAGTEVLPIVQSGVTKQVSVADLTAGRAVSASSLTLTGSPLAATSGGTGQSSYAVGDLLYASTTTALSKLADVATGNALISGGVGVAPSWGKIGLATHVSGTLGTTNGGTGLTSFTANGIVYASSTSALATGSTLTWDGTILSTNRINITSTGTGATFSSSGGSGLRIYGASGTNQWDVYLNSTNIRFSDNTGTGKLVCDQDIQTTNNFVVATSGKGITTGSSIPLGLGTNNGVASLTIATGNKVYVNSATAPVVGSEVFGVAGGGAIAGAFGNTDATQPTVFISNSSNTTNTYVMRFACGSAGNTRGEIYYNGSAMVYATSSDYRLKENVRPLTNALDKLAQLKPKSFRWVEHQIEDDGFLAHEFKTVFPQSVGGEKDEVDEQGKPKYQTIDASSPSTIAAIVAGILELKQIVDAQAAEIAALKGN